MGEILQCSSYMNDQANSLFLKGFMIIHLLPNWEELLSLTRPENWCPQAVYYATLQFLSSPHHHQLKSFLQCVLLKQSLGFIRNHLFLDPYLNLALRRVMMVNPSLFCKVILIPLCDGQQGGGCSLKEASLFGDIILKSYIPASSVANTLISIAQLSDHHYFICHSVFIILLLEKKVALPFRVLECLVHHFCSMNHQSKMPLLWYHSFYLFVEIYVHECVSEQKERLIETIQLVFHPQWSTSIHQIISRTIYSSLDSCQQNDSTMMIEDDDSTNWNLNSV
ncbi:Bystin [Halteromyces radiatus]|uniref:Bystin n=1 Tax=Halteromyces radiatus TaxID=101107 RepID=UPI0022200B73|nr:Bystin [Halteromyces radiatus]KAI8096712.1 Bystin [Halteromyces radiatus]